MGDKDPRPRQGPLSLLSPPPPPPLNQSLLLFYFLTCIECTKALPSTETKITKINFQSYHCVPGRGR